MKRLIAILSIFLIVSCGSRVKLSPEEAAMQAARDAAQESYEHLLAGRYDQFVSARVGADSLPPSYREQLTAACKQYMAQQRTAHNGIASFQVSNAVIDSTQSLIQVFLVLQFGDSTKEEIVVPMVEHEGSWKMK